MVNVAIDGVVQEAQADEPLIDLINHSGVSVPPVCYHPQVGPVQTCDTCTVEVYWQLIRAGATPAAGGMKVSTKSAKAVAAQVEAFDRMLGNHMLYCTVCNKNGNCTVHNTTKSLAIEHQRIPFRSKPSCKPLDAIFTHQEVKTTQT